MRYVYEVWGVFVILPIMSISDAPKLPNVGRAWPLVQRVPPSLP